MQLKPVLLKPMYLLVAADVQYFFWKNLLKASLFNVVKLLDHKLAIEINHSIYYFG